MRTRTVNLTEHFHRLIESGITSGRYRNASEMVLDGLRLLEQRDHEDRAKLQFLRKAAKAGFDEIDRGPGIEFRSVDERDAFIEQIGDEVSAEIADEPTRG
jgi:antitoxin ParD1/3/4